MAWIIIEKSFITTDAFFLCYEKRYRALYNEVRQITNDNAVDFKMKNSDILLSKYKWASSFTSNTFYAFYLALFILHIAIYGCLYFQQSTT